MEFEFTKRHATVAKRFAEVNFQYAMDKLDEVNLMTSEELNKFLSSDDNILARIFMNKIRMEIRVLPDYDDDDDEYLIGTAKCTIHLRGDEVSAFYNKHTYTELLKINIWIDSLVKTYSVCKCNKHMAEKDGWCRECFPFVMEQPDVCCCCLENEGVWGKLPCNHILHSYCFYKIANWKCPLCRADSEPHLLKKI
jgi:hypothetical protein